MNEHIKWYVLKVISGQEFKAKAAIELEILHNKWENIIFEILVPTEKVYKIRAGKKYIKDKTLFPGYIYLEVNEKLFTTEMISTLRGITSIINFLGGNQPQTLRPAEIQKLLGKIDEGMEGGEMQIDPFIINESVKIVDGPFNDFIGSIQEINEDKRKLKVVVMIFGRKQPVEVGYSQVVKIQ
ncbi:MAG: transcription termination/antitermination protein NusG [Chitinophagales bacterium]|jgi:transcriptional antiterminator NusG|nr:transcription termination/antitermination protein NusG [Chitinophagales bacterium]